MLWRKAVIFKLFWAKSFTGLLVKNFRLVLRIRRVMFFAQQAEQTLAHLSQLCWNLSLLGVNKRLAHAQVGFLKGFHSKCPMSIPGPFIWESPTVEKYTYCVTAWHVTKNSKNPVRGGSSGGHFSRLTSGRELTVLPPARGFPFNLWDRVNSSSTSLHLLGRSLGSVSKLDSPPP